MWLSGVIRRHVVKHRAIVHIRRNGR